MYASAEELLELALRCKGGQLEFHQSKYLTFTGRIVDAALEDNGLKITLAYRARMSNGEWKLDRQQAAYAFTTRNCAILNIEDGVHQLVWKDNSLIFFLREPHVSKIKIIDPFTPTGVMKEIKYDA